MYDFIESFTKVKEAFPERDLSVKRQLAAMTKGVKQGMRPFDYFDNGVYLHEENDPRHYLGIEQAADLWKRLGPHNTKYSGSLTYAHVFGSKFDTKNWLRSHRINTPADMLAGQFVDMDKSFVLKHDGKGVPVRTKIFLFEPAEGRYRIQGTLDQYSRDDILYMGTQIAEQHIPPLPSSFIPYPYAYGTAHLLFYTSRGYTQFLAGAQRFRRILANTTDGYRYAGNAVTGVNAAGRVEHAPIGRGFTEDNLPPLREMPQHSINPALAPSFTMAKLALTAALSKIDTSGMLIGFDIMPTFDEPNQYPGFAVLRANLRPRFDVLQVANRQGAQLWVRPFA